VAPSDSLATKAPQPPLMAAFSIELDRDYRRRVRKSYYLRRENFETDRGFDDYLEQVEELVEDLINEKTRPKAQAKLNELSIKHAQQTAENRSRYDTDVQKREAFIERERAEAAQAAQERREAEQRAIEAAKAKRDALQQSISAGTKTVAEARTDLRSHAAAAASQSATAAVTAAPSAAAPSGTSGAYVPTAPQPRALVQPVDAALAREVTQRKPEFMQPSLTAAKDAYESDPKLLLKVRIAGGYDPTQWRKRYQQEALCIPALWRNVRVKADR